MAANQHLVDLDLAGNQLIDAIIENATSGAPPTASGDGQLYYATDTDVLYLRANGAWVIVGSTTDLWATISADSGSDQTATSPTDTLEVAGGTNIATAMTADTVTTNLSIDSNVAFAHNQAIDFVLENSSAEPGTPVEGQLYYDTDNDTIYLYTSSGWTALAAAGGANLWSQITSQSGNTTADSPTDNLTINGDSTYLTTAISGDTLTISAVVEGFEDLTGGMVTGNTETGITVTYQVADNTIDFELDDEYLEDVAGTMVANGTGTHTGITVTYQDTTGDMDFEVDVLDQLPSPTGSLSLNSQKITSLADGTADGDAVNLGQLSSYSSGIDWKESVRLATDESFETKTGSAPTLAGSKVGKTITNAGTQAALVIDSVAVAASDRILVKNETDDARGDDDGIYTVTNIGSGSTNWVLTRATDADEDDEVTAGLAAFVEEGTENADTGWVLTTNDAITVDTTVVAFTQFTGLGQITAGAALTKTGNLLDVNVDDTSIEVNADALRIDTTWVGQSAITTVGTISSGTWQGTTVAVDQGGTGNTTFTDNGVVYGDAGNALDVTAAGSQYQVLQAGASSVPTFGALNLAQTAATTNELLIARGGTNSDAAALGTTNHFLVYDGTRITASAYDQSDFATGGHTHDSVYTKTFAADIGDTSTTDFQVTHNFNTRDVIVKVRETASPYEYVEPEIQADTADAVGINFNTAPGTDEYRVIIIGVDT